MHAAHTRLWVLLADGRRARIVIPDEAQGRFRAIVALGVAEHPHYPPPLPGATAPLHRPRFAVDVASRLNEEAGRDEFDELLLVAPRQVAHEIRVALNAATAARVVGTLDRDPWMLGEEALWPQLARWWQAPPAEPVGAGEPSAAALIP
jgi:hypothetical protein